ncbi:hypothetical protein [Streptomyces sp. NPDC094147]|uniref:hypothetical protein n=1 Tax=Streptomyces sp. NPDC094147 TaxID=3366057 RepID=UPI003824B515
MVNTLGNGARTWGNALVHASEVITSEACSGGLCHELGPEQLTALTRSAPVNGATAYVVRHFGRFNFTGVSMLPPTRTFSGREMLLATGAEPFEPGLVPAIGGVLSARSVIG